MFVYQITNKVNGKKYVGQHAGEDLQKYWLHNVYRATSGFRGKPALYRAICKYGVDNFEVKPLVIVGTKQELDYYEIELIRIWDTTNPDKGYNITAGGGGSYGVKRDEETKVRMAAAHVGLKMPESHSRKLSERNKGNKYSLGRKMTKENFDKLMAVHIGAKRSDETRQRLSDSHKGKKASEETKQRMRDAQKGRREKERNDQSASRTR
jgi:group I intron endonuclease